MQVLVDVEVGVPYAIGRNERGTRYRRLRPFHEIKINHMPRSSSVNTEWVHVDVQQLSVAQKFAN